jgi:seryl-tRNA synthetase
MHDLKFIRDYPDAFDAGLTRRGLPKYAAEILALDEKRRSLQTHIQEKQALRNKLSGAIGAARKAGDTADADRLTAEVSALKTEMPQLEAQEAEIAQQLDHVLSSLPNLPAPAPQTPEGANESYNVELAKVGLPRWFGFPVKSHDALGEALGLMDFSGAAKLSGARFVVLKGALARLERALGQFMLDIHTAEFGFSETSVPLLVRDAAMMGTGQLPKFREDQFAVDGGYWLIPTAEVPLTNLYADAVHDAALFPARHCALSACFRAEAGAAGRDTAGMIRQHQFFKVELVTVCTPEQAEAEYARVLNAAETILQRLDLPYRSVALCAGDIGFSASRTVDLEVWLPSQNTYREISSVSHFDTFQARRMKARYKGKDDKHPQMLHTINGSGLAVGRTLVAVMENYQNDDGSISIPEVLQPYTGFDLIRV